MNSKLLLLFIAVAVFGQNCTNPLNVGTFNTQLILTAPFRQERLQAQIQYFQTNAQNLEILCLQEIWDPSFRQQYVSSLQSVFPNAFYPANFPLNNSQCTRSCAEGTLASLSGCLSGAGCFANNNNQASCALNNCRNIFNGLDNTCSACIASSLNLDLNDRINQCSNDGVSASQCARFFNGYTDPLILSKYPFLATDHLLFSNSPLTETTVLYARVNTTELGPVNVFCTHLLPANFQIVDFSSVNRDQTQQMLSYVQSKVIGMEPIVLMGDFNFGPAISSNIEASWPQNYQLVSDSGFVSSFLAANPNPTCTYCTQNPLNIGINSYVIDHIFVKNASIVNSTLFATNAQVQAGGRQVPLSDHYGVAASLCPGVPSTVPTFGATPVTGTQSTGVIISIPGVINNQVGASSIVSVSLLLVALCYLFTVIF